MSENVRMIIWGLFIIYDLYVVLDYEMNGRKFKNDKIRKSRPKNRKTTPYRRCGTEPTLIWNDLDRMYGNHR